MTVDSYTLQGQKPGPASPEALWSHGIYSRKAFPSNARRDTGGTITLVPVTIQSDSHPNGCAKAWSPAIRRHSPITIGNKGQIRPAAYCQLNGGIPAYTFLPIEIQMPSINIDGLKDDASWRRVMVSLLDPPVADEWLETMRIQLIERLRCMADEVSVNT